MTRNLTNSKLDRQNILNNEFAISTIQDQTKIAGIMFEGRIRFTKSMVAKYFNVDVRTIERYISDNLSEISQNGYEIIRGARLKELFRAIDNLNAPDIDVGSISNRTSQISLFDFKAFLNSESANFPLFFLRFPISSNLFSKMAVFETKGSPIHRLVSNFPLFETKDMLARWEKGARYAGTIQRRNGSLGRITAAVARLRLRGWTPLFEAVS